MHATSAPPPSRAMGRTVAVAVMVAAATLAAWRVLSRGAGPVPVASRRTGNAGDARADGRPPSAPPVGTTDAGVPTAPPRRAARPREERRRRERLDRRQRGDARAVFSTDAGTTFPTASQTTRDNVAGLEGGAGTIALWVQPGWAAGDPAGATLVELGDDRVRLAKAGRVLRFDLVDGRGARVAVEAPIADWRPGDWHHVVATWDGRTVALYVDGAPVATAVQRAAASLPPGTPLYVGSVAGSEPPAAPGVMAGVTIRNRPLGAAAVAHRFEAGPHPGG